MIKTMKEVVIEFESEMKQVARGDFGRWRFNRRALVLTHDQGYEIDIEECRTSAQVLDKIIQVTAKTWADDATIADLCRAIRFVLDPQANLCSCGVERGPVDWAARAFKEIR